METAERIRLSVLARWGMRTLEERFWAKVDKSGECWLWTGATRNGYGHFAMHGGPQYAHRLSWTLTHHEAIPQGMEICHSCDVQRCVRPSHLWLGTRGQNAADMGAKGRSGAWRLRKAGPPKIRATGADTWSAKQAALRTSCKWGHPFPENRSPYGGCIECRAIANREAQRRRRARRI